MKCSCCGKDIGEIAFDKGYKMPDDVWSLPNEERESRAEIDSDLCRLDDRYFLRGVAYIPVLGVDKCYGWGFWAEVSEDSFIEYVEAYEQDNSSKPRFTGFVANQISFYENTLGLELEVKLGDETQRPTFYFKDSNHALTEEQASGISIEKVHTFSGA